MIGIRVLINTRDINYKGGVVNFYRILNLHALNNVDYYYISYSNHNFFQKLFYLPISYFKFYFKIKKYNIVHLNPSLTKVAIWRDLLFLFLAKLRKKKVIVFFHGWDNALEDKIKKRRHLQKLFLYYNKADAFFVSGTIFKKKLISMGVNKIKNFYLETMIADNRYINDFSVEAKIKDFYNKNTPIIFLFMSRITKGKGMNLAVDIFNAISNKSKKKMKLIIAGDGDLLNETKKYVKLKKVENIEFPGYVRDEDKHKLLSNCHVTLFPTMYGEGIPNTVLEGCLYGMPIISRINAGIPDWIENNKNGYITKSKNHKDFIPFLDKLMGNNKIFEEIARNNHMLAKENFTSHVITKRFLMHYKEVLNVI